MFPCQLTVTIAFKIESSFIFSIVRGLSRVTTTATGCDDGFVNGEREVFSSYSNLLTFAFGGSALKTNRESGRITKRRHPVIIICSGRKNVTTRRGIAK